MNATNQAYPEQFSNKGYYDLDVYSIEAQLDDYACTPPIRTFRHNHGLRMNGYATINGKTALLLSCDNISWYDGENHGRRSDVSLESHCMAISFDGTHYYAHILYKDTLKDITAPLRIPMFNDYERHSGFPSTCDSVWTLTFMLAHAIKAEGKSYIAEDLSFNDWHFVNNFNCLGYEDSRNYNINNYDYAAKDYATKGGISNSGTNFTERLKNQNYRW